MLLTDAPADGGGRLTRGQIGSLLTGLVLLAVAWIGPLPALAAGSFSAHMTLHMVLVAVVAPLLALGVAGTRADPVRLAPGWYSPIVASVVEFAIVSGWHAPVLHHAARAGGAPFAAEQASFLAAGLLLWWSAAGGGRGIEPWRPGAGAAAMLFTSIHMTLVGALFALAPRPLFVHTPDDPRADGARRSAARRRDHAARRRGIVPDRRPVADRAAPAVEDRDRKIMTSWPRVDGAHTEVHGKAGRTQ
jgi:putative membrane protein